MRKYKTGLDNAERASNVLAAVTLTAGEDLKMSQNEKVLMLAALLLAHSAATDAVPVTVTETSSVSVLVPPSFTFSFAPIVNADELLSVSGGSFFTGESGTFSVDVDYVVGPPQQIFSTALVSFNTVNLSSSLANLSFTPGTINGLTFNFTNSCCSGSLTIPQGTTFTFDAAPVRGGAAAEPMSLALILAAAATGLLNSRRRRLRAADQPATSE
jgi:hypothetical protein